MPNPHGTLQAPGVSDPAAFPTDINQSHVETFAGRQSSGTTPNSTEQPPANGGDAWIGRHLDRYAVVKKLGGGGMGEVYLARHRFLDIPVAIKLLHSSYGGNAKALERFRREARLVASLNHPNIVRALDGGPVEGSFYLATEYIDGLDLEQLVRSHGAFPPRYAAWLVAEVARGLQHAHEKQLVHRDIKPSNIMLLRDGSVKLLDLGLARNLNSNSAMTSTGQFMGTVDYVSPEQSLDTRSVDHRTDIYSLGCTLYFLIAGRAPFEGEAYDSVASKILAHTEEYAIPLETFCPQTPPVVLETVSRMMEKSPEDRIQTAAEVIEALAPIAEPPPGASPRFASSPTPSQAMSKSASKSSIDEDFDKISNAILHVLWIVLRTILSILGILERVEVTSHSRIGGKKRYTWEVSAKGVGIFVVAVLMILFFLSHLVIIEPVDPHEIHGSGHYETGF